MVARSVGRSVVIESTIRCQMRATFHAVVVVDSFIHSKHMAHVHGCRFAINEALNEIMVFFLLNGRHGVKRGARGSPFTRRVALVEHFEYFDRADAKVEERRR